MSLMELSKDEIETMKVVDLKKHLKDLKLATTGTKSELQKRLTDALMASKQAKTDPKNNNNNNNKKPPSSANKSGENNNSSSSAATTAAAVVVAASAESNTNTQEKNTNADASAKTEEKKNSEADEKNKEKESNNNPTNNTGSDDTTSTTTATAQKKLSSVKRIEVEGLPEELLVWDVDETKKTNGISRNLGVTTAEFMLQRQERIKKYGMKAMPEQVKRMVRKQRFLSGNGDTNKSPSKDEDKGDDNIVVDAAPNDPNNRSDFSIQSLLASDGTSDGLTREKLSQRKKRFGHAAIESAFQQSMQTGFENRNNRNGNNQNRNNQNRNNQYRNNQNRNNQNRNNQNRNNQNRNNQNRNNQNRNRNNNNYDDDNYDNNNDDNNNVTTTTNQFRNIHRNRDRNMTMDDKIKARMERFGTKPTREDGNRRGFDRDWHRMDRDRDRRRPQDRHHSARRNNNDRSRSRQRNRDNEIESFDESENVVESIIHTATKSGGIIKDFGSDDEMGLSAEDLERIEQRKKRFEA